MESRVAAFDSLVDGMLVNSHILVPTYKSCHSPEETKGSAPAFPRDTEVLAPELLAGIAQ